jgi:hypothetical protein
MQFLQRTAAAVAAVFSVIVLVPPAIASASLALKPAKLPNGPVGQFYDQTITATGGIGPYTFAATGKVPAGITVASDGTVSGTPSVNESGTFTVQATDSSSPAITGKHSYTLVFGLVFSTTSLPKPNVGTAYSKQIVVKGGTAALTFSVTAGAPPPGITVSSSGLVTGSATTPGSYSFTVGVVDSGSPQQSNSHSFTMKVGILGDWTLCAYSSGSAGTNIDGVTLASGGSMSDVDGATGTWALSASNRLTMDFVFRHYVGNWDAGRNQFDGTYTGPDNGTWAMVIGRNNGPNCIQP